MLGVNLYDLPQMTHIDVRKSSRQHAFFVYLTFRIDENGYFKLYNSILSNCPISSDSRPRFGWKLRGTPDKENASCNGNSGTVCGNKAREAGNKGHRHAVEIKSEINSE